MRAAATCRSRLKDAGEKFNACISSASDAIQEIDPAMEVAQGCAQSVAQAQSQIPQWANAKKILETANKIKNEIKTIPDLFVLGDPLFNVSFSSHTIDIYKVMESMTHKNWSLNGLHKPSCVHICVTLRHAQEGVAERFITDLRESVAYVKAHPSEKGEMAPVYGMAATIPDRTAVADLLDMYMDLLYKIE